MHDEVDQYVRYNVYKKKASKNKWAMANKILKQYTIKYVHSDLQLIYIKTMVNNNINKQNEFKAIKSTI